MNESIPQIVAELVNLDPELKDREAELAALVTELTALKPAVVPDEAFIASLKLKLLARAAELAPVPAHEPQHASTPLFMTIASFIRAPYLVISLVVAAIALLVVTSLPSALRRSGSVPFAHTGITRVAAGAFGSLAVADGSFHAPAGSGAGAKSDFGELNRAADRSVAGPQAPVAAPAADAALKAETTAIGQATPSIAPGFGGGGTADRAFIYPYPSLSYRYAGEPVADLPAEVDVLRRIKNVGLPVSGNFLGSFDLGSVNLGSFSSVAVSQLTLTEDKEFGYVINIDFPEGTVNIFENWRRWPQPFNDCRDEACYRNLQLQPADVPSDEELIRLANQFLSDHGIDRSVYGAPTVQNEWRAIYEQALDQTQLSVPDVITVMYPLQVNGTTVYEYGGTATGLGVNVNVRYQRVSSLWNLTSQQYQASAYEAETDFDRLVKYATAGNQGYPIPLMMPVTEGDPNGLPQQIMSIDLGTPTRGYLRYWHYQGTDNQELLLPALIFPVLNQPEQPHYYFGAQAVVVPLVKEFLNATNPVMDGPVKIMPAPSTGTGSSSSGSAGAATGTTAVEPEPALLPQE